MTHLRHEQCVFVAAAGGKTQQGKMKPFLESSYSYMPLVWGATLAFWLGPALAEGGHILPVSNPPVFCPRSLPIPPFPRAPNIAFDQEATLLPPPPLYPVLSASHSTKKQSACLLSPLPLRPCAPNAHEIELAIATATVAWILARRVPAWKSEMLSSGSNTFCMLKLVLLCACRLRPQQ